MWSQMTFAAPVNWLFAIRGIAFRQKSSAAILAAGSQASGLRGDGQARRLPASRPEAGATTAKRGYSPNHAPYGRRRSMWSQMTFAAPVIGTARISPIAPHSHPQNNSANVTANGFSRKRLPRILG